jgi:RNA polymerase sigma-70 factor, ECF subfamily
LLRAWRRRSTLRERDRRNQWLATIVRNEAFRQHARLRPDPVATIEGHEGADDERVVATVERADLHAALGRLSDRDRQLLLLRYDEDLTQAAIASRLGIPEGTVKVRLHRARDKLRRAMAWDSMVMVAATTGAVTEPRNGEIVPMRRTRP